MNFIKILQTVTPNFIIELRKLYINTRPLAPRKCPICNFDGFFRLFGKPPRIDAQCPKCESLERHRLFWLELKRNTIHISEPIIHFAAEPILEKKFRETYKSYRTADLYKKADICLNIEQIDLESSSVKTIVCNHVLEHVDDIKALIEINRVLEKNGTFICSVPIIDGWNQTYENETVKTDFDRELHFGQYDHIRYYGRDFKNRLEQAGFHEIIEHVAYGQDVVKYGLLRGDKFYTCKK